MKTFILSSLNDIITMILIILFVFLATDTSSMLLSMIYWIIAYFTLDAHVAISNKLGNKYNLFINN